MPRLTIFNNMITPYTNRLYNLLFDSGVDLSIISCTRQESNRTWAHALNPKYPHEILKGKHFRLGAGRFAHFNFGIIAALRRARPDLLIINGFYPSMLLAAAWAVFTRTPLGLTIDGWDQTMPRSVLHRIVRALILPRCRVVVTCGLKGRNYFLGQDVQADRISIVPIAPAWERTRQVPSAETRDFDLLWCAHLNDDVKNASFFVDVAIILKKTISNLSVLIVGQGPAEREALSRLTAAGIHFEHLPTVEWYEMEQIYARSKILLLPSKWEPWGLVCNEAMLMGTPCVVSTAVGAGDDLVVSGINGWVLELETQQWADKIKDLLLNDSDLDRFGVHARIASERRTTKSSAAIFRATLENMSIGWEIARKNNGMNGDLK